MNALPTTVLLVLLLVASAFAFRGCNTDIDCKAKPNQECATVTLVNKTLRMCVKKGIADRIRT